MPNTLSPIEAATGIALQQYLTVAAILFTLGVFRDFSEPQKRHHHLMSIELMLLAVNINLVALSAYLNDITGQIYALIVLTVAAAEAAIGLGIVVIYFRNRGSIAVDDINVNEGLSAMYPAIGLDALGRGFDSGSRPHFRR